MGREIQRECDWHFCSGPHLCHQQEGPEGQRWAKSHTWHLQVERNHLNHDYDLKKTVQVYLKECASVFEGLFGFCARLLYFCTSYADFTPRGSTEDYVWQHIQRHDSLTNCCILRLSTVMPLQKSQNPLCSSISWTEMNQKKIRTSTWAWPPSATIISSAVKLIKLDFHPCISNTAHMCCYKWTITTINVNIFPQMSVL